MASDPVYMVVYSPKGGTGKTTISAHLAFEYARAGSNVLLIDCAQFGNISSLLKLNTKGKGFSTLLSFYEFSEDSEGVKLEELLSSCVITHECEKIKFDVLVSALPLKMESMEPDFIDSLFDCTGTGKYNIIIIDTSSEVCLRNISVLSRADLVLLTVEEDIGSIWSLIQCKDILSNINVLDKCLLIVNRISKHSMISIREIEEELVMQVFQTLPEEQVLKHYNNTEGGICKRGSRFYKDIRHLVDRIEKVNASFIYKKRKRK